MPARDVQPCLECMEAIETNEAALSFNVFGRTVGIQHRVTSETRVVYVCVECALSVAMGKAPRPTKPLSQLIYAVICEMTAGNAAVVIAAWQQLRKRMNLPPCEVTMPMITEGEIIPPGQALRLAK
jgi:hypothetical protein